MENYKEIYLILFNRITDIIKELEDIQKSVEEKFINYDEEKDVK